MVPTQRATSQLPASATRSARSSSRYDRMRSRAVSMTTSVDPVAALATASAGGVLKPGLPPLARPHGYRLRVSDKGHYLSLMVRTHAGSRPGRCGVKSVSKSVIAARRGPCRKNSLQKPTCGTKTVVAASGAPELCNLHLQLERGTVMNAMKHTAGALLISLAAGAAPAIAQTNNAPWVDMES